jgi:hypothetical protein
MLTNGTLTNVTLLAQELEARGIFSAIGKGIAVVLVIILLVGVLIGFFIGRLTGRR